MKKKSSRKRVRLPVVAGIHGAVASVGKPLKQRRRARLARSGKRATRRGPNAVRLACEARHTCGCDGKQLRRINEWLQLHYARLLGYAISLNFSPPEEGMNEAWLKLPNNFDPDRAGCFSIFYRAMIWAKYDWLRKLYRSPLKDSVGEEALAAFVTEIPELPAEVSAKLRCILSHLSIRSSAVLALSLASSGVPQEVLAGQLQLSVPAFKMRLLRAREELGQFLQKRGCNSWAAFLDWDVEAITFRPVSTSVLPAIRQPRTSCKGK